MKWEYLVLCIQSAVRDEYNLETLFDHHGNKGWELVCITGDKAIFKRLWSCD